MRGESAILSGANDSMWEAWLEMQARYADEDFRFVFKHCLELRRALKRSRAQAAIRVLNKTQRDYEEESK